MFNIAKVGAYIKILRKAKKMTQGKLAETLGISYQAVSNWERGAALPDVTLLLGLAEALGTTVDRLLSASRDDFTGFDEILENVEIIPAKICTNCSVCESPGGSDASYAPDIAAAAEMTQMTDEMINEAELLREIEENLLKINEL